MNTIEVRPDLRSACDSLFLMCLRSNTHHDRIGHSLRILQNNPGDLIYSAGYWLLCSLAIELYQPYGAPRYIKYYLSRARACPDFEKYKPHYDRQRVSALRRRIERSSASINKALKNGYELRLEQALACLSESVPSSS